MIFDNFHLAKESGELFEPLHVLPYPSAGRFIPRIAYVFSEPRRNIWLAAPVSSVAGHGLDISTGSARRNW
jgi:hypothetical protein